MSSMPARPQQRTTISDIKLESRAKFKYYLRSPSAPSSDAPGVGIYLCEDGKFHDTNPDNHRTGSKPLVCDFETASRIQYKHIKQTGIILILEVADE